MIRLSAILIGLAMLIPSDINAASNSRLGTNGVSALKSVATVRAATVETLTFATYPASSDSTVISHTFDANSLQTGNQVRFFIWGEITNTSGATRSFSPSVYVTQASAIQSAGVLYQAPNGVTQFVIDGAVSFSVPGPAQSNPNDKRTNAESNGTVLAAGSLVRLQNRTAATTVAQDFSVVSDPNTLLIDGFHPVGVSVVVNTGSSLTFTVLGGWMEAL